MDLLLESPVPALAVGVILLTLAAIVWFQTRSGVSFAAMVGAGLLTLLGIGVERWWQTPREQLVATLGKLLDAVEANDLPRVLEFISPTATQVVADANELMPLLTVKQANPGSEPDVQFDDPSAPKIATVTFTPLIVVTHKQSGVVGGYNKPVTMNFTRTGEQWLITGYTAKENWRRGVRG